MLMHQLFSGTQEERISRLCNHIMHHAIELSRKVLCDPDAEIICSKLKLTKCCVDIVSNHLDIGQTTIDTRKHPRHTRRLIAVYRNHKRRRILCLDEEPHHIQVTQDFNHFLFNKWKATYRYVHVYDMYLELVSHGCDTYFNDKGHDPMLAVDLKDYNSKMKKMNRTLLTRKKDCQKSLPISVTLKDYFYSSQRSEQNRILTTLKFEFSMFSLQFKNCEICQTKTLGHLFDEKKSLICINCEKLKFRTKKEKIDSYIEKTCYLFCTILKETFIIIFQMSFLV